jgi:hypothetical protein
MEVGGECRIYAIYLSIPATNVCKFALNCEGRQTDTILSQSPEKFAVRLESFQ